MERTLGRDVELGTCDYDWVMTAERVKHEDLLMSERHCWVVVVWRVSLGVAVYWKLAVLGY